MGAVEDANKAVENSKKWKAKRLVEKNVLGKGMKRGPKLGSKNAPKKPEKK